MKTIYRTMIVVLAAQLVVDVPQAGAQAQVTSRSADSVAAVATVERFHQLLSQGDSAGAVRLLAPDLTVMESGGLENRTQFLGHHLGVDMEFSKAVPVQRTIATVVLHGDVAWIAATSTARGKFRDRDVNSRGAELMVLTRSAEGWLIRAIHWSSRRAAP